MKQLSKYQVTVLGASVDDVAANRRFAEMHGYPFPLLCDSDRRLAKALGVVSMAGYAKRWTYVVDPRGTIRAIVKDVEPETHGRDLLKLLQSLKVPRKHA